MYLTILDLVLILIVFSFVAVGFALGFIQAIGGLIGMFIGAWVSAQYYQSFGDWLSQYLLGNTRLGQTIAFILIFTVINRLVGLVFYIINKVFKLISIIPFTKTLNRVLGAAFGFVEGVLVSGLILTFLVKLGVSAWLVEAIEGSKIAAVLLFITKIIAPLLPALFKTVTAII